MIQAFACRLQCDQRPCVGGTSARAPRPGGGHHPDLHVTNYRVVTVVMSTHSVGALTATGTTLAWQLAARLRCPTRRTFCLTPRRASVCTLASWTEGEIISLLWGRNGRGDEEPEARHGPEGTNHRARARRLCGSNAKRPLAATLQKRRPSRRRRLPPPRARMVVCALMERMSTRACAAPPSRGRSATKL